MKRFAIGMIVAGLLLCSPVFTQEEGIITVTAIGKARAGESNPGRARVEALRAAKVEAFRKIALAMGMKNRENREIQAFLRGAKVVSQRQISDYEAEVVMSVHAADVFLQVSDYERKNGSRHVRSAMAEELRRLEGEVETLRKKIAALSKQFSEEEEK